MMHIPVLALLVAVLAAGCAGTKSSVSGGGPRSKPPMAFPITQEEAEFVMHQAMTASLGATVSPLSPPALGYRGHLAFIADRHDFTITALPIELENARGEDQLLFAFEVSHSGTMLISGPTRAQGIYNRTLEGAGRIAEPVELTPEQVFKGQRRRAATGDARGTDEPSRRLRSSGSGFFVSTNGFLVTNYHVVQGASNIEVRMKGKSYPATVVRWDRANDLAVLKVEGGGFAPLPLALSSEVRLGDPVFTIGFPNPEAQGYEPKFTDGRISGLSGFKDDASQFQISVPVQPGNSGGPLIDANGNVVGIIVSRLNDLYALRTTGSLPQTVNYAIKGDYCGLLLAGNPDAAQHTPRPNDSPMRWEDAVSAGESAVALIVAQ